MTVAEVIEHRGIREVLHFTTNLGLTGIVASRVLHPRARLSDDNYVEHVAMANCAVRYDPQYLDYVNLSIGRIASLFDISRTRWHASKDLWWCVLSFRPEILTHDGVIFTTTNNKWHKSVLRAPGTVGLEQMFAERVQYFERPPQTEDRHPGLRLNMPTHREAEVLYPGDLNLEYLQTVYVATERHDRVAFAQLKLQGIHDRVSVEVNPERFK